MSSDGEDSPTTPQLPTIICKLVLAPSEDPKDPITNTGVVFQIAVGPETYGTVARAARILVEESASASCYIPFIANRYVDDSSLSTTALEFFYGDGYKTFVKRKSDTVVPKSCLPVGINVSIGAGGEHEKVDELAFLMPDDLFYPHVRDFAEEHGKHVKPVVYIRTGHPICRYPENHDNESAIALTIPGSKKGYWFNACFVSGEREDYPTEGVPKPPSIPKKRKQPDGEDDSSR